MKSLSLFRFFITFIILLGSNQIFAHVKWFSEYSFGDEPLQMVDVTNTIFWILTITSMVVVALLTLVDEKIKSTDWYQKITSQLGKYENKSVLIMRIATGVVLLMAWQLGKLVMPELAVESSVLMWFQFLLAFLLLFRVTLPIVGVGLVFLYLIGIYLFGLFHMLDYLLLVGIAYFFITSNAKNPKFKNTGLLLIYVTVGFSLCWAGMEKLIYPNWGTSLLELHPQIAMGLTPNLFIQGAAFIEISVGIMFIFGFFQRILAIVVTLLFFLTTMVFGEVEVAGHLLIHAALLIFIIEGSGRIFKTLPSSYRQLGRNPIFAGLGFALLLFVFIVPYTYGANLKYTAALQTITEEHPDAIEISDTTIVPQLDVKVNKDESGGWHIELMTQNFKLQSPQEIKTVFQNNGYAVLSIDKKLITRVYNSTYYLPTMKAGTYEVEVNLYSLGHQPLTHLGLPISANTTIIVE